MPAEPSEGQVAAAQVADDGVDGIGPKAEVELGVQGMREEELHHQLPGAELEGETPQRGFIVRSGAAPGQLIAELIGGLFAHPAGGGVVEELSAPYPLQGFTQIGFLQSLHPDQQAALMAVTARPVLYHRINRLPAAQVEVADGEIRTLAECQRLPQRGQKLRLDIVKDSRHGALVFGTMPQGPEGREAWGIQQAGFLEVLADGDQMFVEPRRISAGVGDSVDAMEFRKAADMFAQPV